jgi:hypothetical protein
MFPSHPAEAKAAARALRAALAPQFELSHGQALDLLARTLGLADWNTLAARYHDALTGPAMPILRVYEESLARRFYVEWLGFQVDFEHRFGPGHPLFLGVSRGPTTLGLSGHHGDGTPGSAVWIPVTNLRALRERLVADDADAQRPGIDREAPGGPTLTVTDPFGNELRFCERAG